MYDEILYMEIFYEKLQIKFVRGNFIQGIVVRGIFDVEKILSISWQVNIDFEGMFHFFKDVKMTRSTKLIFYRMDIGTFVALLLKWASSVFMRTSSHFLKNVCLKVGTFESKCSVFFRYLTLKVVHPFYRQNSSTSFFLLENKRKLILKLPIEFQM